MLGCYWVAYILLDMCDQGDHDTYIGAHDVTHSQWGIQG